MKYVTYKGAIYSKVTERIKALKALGRPYSLTTIEERVEMDNLTFWKVKVMLQLLDTSEVFTGLAMRRYEKDHPFGSYPLEWAETIATARAIGKLGIGIDYAYACLEELGGLDQTEVVDTEQAPKVEHAFTQEEMKSSLEAQDAPVIAKEQPEPDQSAKTKAEKLAQKLDKKKKPTRVIDIPIETPVKDSKPDKIDSALQAMENDVRTADPVFDEPPILDPDPEPPDIDIPEDPPEFENEVIIEID